MKASKDATNLTRSALPLATEGTQELVTCPNIRAILAFFLRQAKRRP